MISMWSVFYTYTTQRLQMDLLLKSANLTALLTTWHGALSQVNPTLNRFTLSQPPTIIYKTAAKDI